MGRWFMIACTAVSGEVRVACFAIDESEAISFARHDVGQHDDVRSVSAIEATEEEAALLNKLAADYLGSDDELKPSCSEVFARMTAAGLRPVHLAAAVDEMRNPTVAAVAETNGKKASK